MEIKPGYKQTEVGVLPDDWQIYALDKIGTFKNGINKSAEAFGHGAPFVNLMDIFGVNSIDSTEHLGLIASNRFEQTTYDLRRGDTIFVRSSVKPSGVGLTAVVKSDLPNTVYSGFLIRFRDRNYIDIDLKKHCFYDSQFRTQVISASSVSANTNINQDSLKRLLIALPPSQVEQKAIAEALSDADALIESLEQLIAKKRDIKQGAMQGLLTGKRRLPGFSGEWTFKRLGDIAELKNGYAFKSNTYNSLGQFRIITIANVQDGYLDITQSNRVADLPKEIQPHQNLNYGDILISMTGNVGRVCRVSESNCLLNQRVGKLVSYSVNPLLLFAMLSQRQFLTSMVDKAKGGAQGNLSVTDIIGHEFQMPTSENEQEAIATILSDMDTEIITLEAKLSKARSIKQGMMQELLTGRIRLV